MVSLESVVQIRVMGSDFVMAQRKVDWIDDVHVSLEVLKVFQLYQLHIINHKHLVVDVIQGIVDVICQYVSSFLGQADGYLHSAMGQVNYQIIHY